MTKILILTFEIQNCSRCILCLGSLLQKRLASSSCCSDPSIAEIFLPIGRTSRYPSHSSVLLLFMDFPFSLPHILLGLSMASVFYVLLLDVAYSNCIPACFQFCLLHVDSLAESIISGDPVCLYNHTILESVM